MGYFLDIWMVGRGGGGYNWKYNVPLGYWERYPLDLGADKLELCGSLLKIKYK